MFSGNAQKTIQAVDGSKVKVKKLDQQVAFLMDSLEMPGLSLAIINENEIVYHKVFGVQNAETKTAVTKASIFEGASLSKPIFAYFAMKMAEQGILDLDKPLHEYMPHPAIVPESQEYYKSITPRMVLSHSTGFPNHANNKPIELAHEPGNGFSYSGEAYQYLAAILAFENKLEFKNSFNELWGPFNEIFKDNVTGPMSMQNSSFLWTDYIEENKVYGHKEGKPTDNGLGGWSGKSFNSFSSIHTEAGEYALFIQAMLKRQGMSSATFDEMLSTENRFDADNDLYRETGQTGWGLGFAQKESENGLMHLHTGNNHDFQSYAMFLPEQSYGIVLFTNSGEMLPLVQGLDRVLGEQI